MVLVFLTSRDYRRVILRAVRACCRFSGAVGLLPKGDTKTGGVNRMARKP